MAKKTRVGVGIDLQNDFHDIPKATLSVPGAVKDTERTAIMIKKGGFDTIFTSLDSHYKLDIAHTGWFMHADGTPFGPKDWFTQITSSDLKNGKYVAKRDPKRTLTYLESLEKDGEFPHLIWPDHCLIGTEGQALHPIYFEALSNWMLEHMKWVNFIQKGTNPYTEHFGIFRANIPIQEDPSTQVNQGIFQTLSQHDEIILFGQARTHCVANSLRQMLQIAPNLATKIYVVEDAMSNVAGLPDDFYSYVDSIYADAFKAGVQKIKTTDF